MLAADSGFRIPDSGLRGLLAPQESGRTRSRAPRRVTWAAERRPARHLGPFPPDLGPPRDQRLVGSGHDVELGDGRGPGSVLVTIALGCADLDAGHLGQEIPALLGHVPELVGTLGLLGLSQVAPASMTAGDAAEAGDEDSVLIRVMTILSHSFRIEYDNDNCN
jgi:hypothetical protein